MKKVRIAVIGCGRIGQMHAKNIQLHEKTILACVFDPIDKFIARPTEPHKENLPPTQSHIGKIFESWMPNSLAAFVLLLTPTKFFEMSLFFALD